MTTKNFVSISGVTNRDELAGIDEIRIDEGISFPIVIGYQVSNLSINQGTQNSRQPLFADLGGLDEQTRESGFTSAIHYYTKDNDTIISDLEKVVDIGVNPSAALVQFNTLPPTIDILKKVKGMGFGVIFKVAVSNMTEGGYAVWKGVGVEDISTGSIEPLINQVYQRRGFIDYAMFDPSHGTNLELDLTEDSMAVKFGRGITANPDLRDVGLVYAGGIGPDNVKSLTGTLNSFFPAGVSIDTESKVRVNDKFDLDLAKGYLIEYECSVRA